MDQTIKLTPGRERFCELYLSSGNASQAYRQAFGCDKLKDGLIANRASKLLQAPQLQARIAELRQELQAKATINKEQLLSELEAIIKAKVTNYLDFNGTDINYKDFTTLQDEQLKAIESIKQGKYGIELKLHNKPWAIERLSKMLGYEAPVRKELTGSNGTTLIPQQLSKLTTAELETYHAILEKAK
ncbi:MAG: terminase small subunit [Solitalea-like symbiont of Acarus siro]